MYQKEFGQLRRNFSGREKHTDHIIKIKKPVAIYRVLKNYRLLLLCHSVLDTESRVSRENGNPFSYGSLLLQGQVWIPASAGMKQKKL
jgi:hypothetical protein